MVTAEQALGTRGTAMTGDMFLNELLELQVLALSYNCINLVALTMKGRRAKVSSRPKRITEIETRAIDVLTRLTYQCTTSASWFISFAPLNVTAHYTNGRIGAFSMDRDDFEKINRVMP